MINNDDTFKPMINPQVEKCAEAGNNGNPPAMKFPDDLGARLSIKEKVVYSLAIGSIVAAVTAIFLGIYIEPRGEVHASLLTYFGISAAFCGSLLGISAHYSSETGRFKAEIMRSIGEK